MRRRIRNPYDGPQNKCFACSNNNPIGLRLTFEESDEFLHAEWEPGEYYQGYINMLHGGIAATLLDEIGAWCINIKLGTAGVTSRLTINYLKPVWLSRGKITLKAAIVATESKSAKLASWLYDGNGQVCVESEAEFYLYPEEIARKRLHFPGKEAFYYHEP